MFSSSVIYNSLTPFSGVCAWGMSAPLPCDCAAPVMENNHDDVDYPDVDRDGMLFYGTPASFYDPINIFESNYVAYGQPLDFLRFSSAAKSNLWHDSVRRMKHVIDYITEINSPLTVAPPLRALLDQWLSSVDQFIENFGRAMTPVDIRRSVHAVRSQLNLPAWSWPPIVVLERNPAGELHALLPDDVNHLGLTNSGRRKVTFIRSQLHGDHA